MYVSTDARFTSTMQDRDPATRTLIKKLLLLALRILLTFGIKLTELQY